MLNICQWVDFSERGKSKYPEKNPQRTATGEINYVDPIRNIYKIVARGTVYTNSDTITYVFIHFKHRHMKTTQPTQNELKPSIQSNIYFKYHTSFTYQCMQSPHNKCNHDSTFRHSRLHPMLKRTRVKTHKFLQVCKQAACNKSVHKLSTSCVRTACF